MSAEYSVENHDGRIVDVLTDPEAGARLMIARAGAEMVSLARRAPDGSWRGFLWRDAELGPPQHGWANHATVMGYFIHRLKDQRSVYEGHDIRGGTHSFLRRKTFQAPTVEGAALTYTMTPSEYAPDEYPFRLRMELTYAILSDGAVRVRFDFANQEVEKTTRFSFGLHPGFAVTSLENCEVILPAGTYRRQMAPGDFLSGEIVQIDHAGGLMPFDKAALPGSYLLDLAGVPDRAFSLIDRAGRRRVDLDYAQAPYLTIWSDGNAFICLEPCWGLPDHAEQRPFEQKLGLQSLAAGETMRREFSVSATAS